MRFGDMVTADTSEVEGATTPERYALIVLDRATKWLESRPMKEHNTDNVVAALKHIVADDETVTCFYTDRAPEFINAATTEWDGRMT